jgi:Rrf2 family protein
VLSTTADHALRAVLYLGQRPTGVVASATEIADAIGAPRNYLSKTLHALTRAGVTTSVPGRRGGFALAVPPHRLTLGRLIGVFNEADKPRLCLLGDRPCTAEQPCAAHLQWTQIQRMRDHALRSTTISDLLGGSDAAR